MLFLRLFNAPLWRRAQAFAAQTPASLLASKYWSTTPYYLGERLVKYCAKPEHSDLDKSFSHPHSPDRLAAGLWAQLSEGPATFIFGIHAQQDSASHPVEDTTVNWHSDDNAFVPLARIVIERRDQSERVSSNAMAEVTHFSPWNGLVEHSPAGSVNFARLLVYQAMSTIRTRDNRP